MKWFRMQCILSPFEVLFHPYFPMRLRWSTRSMQSRFMPALVVFSRSGIREKSYLQGRPLRDHEFLKVSRFSSRQAFLHRRYMMRLPANRQMIFPDRLSRYRRSLEYPSANKVNIRTTTTLQDNYVYNAPLGISGSVWATGIGMLTFAITMPVVFPIPFER